MTFTVYPLRFEFRARRLIRFPDGAPANLLRGAFGMILHDRPEYASVFTPRSEEGPSGLADSPRPFVFRARHLDGVAIAPGELFGFQVNVFDPASLPAFGKAFAEFEQAELVSQSDPVAIILNLDPPPSQNTHKLRVEFLSPTELKGSSQPDFATLFRSARNRISTLRALYGEGPLEMDFRGTGERAALVQMTRCELRTVDVVRRSGRTGQVHPLGGSVGVAEYEGEIAEFVPFLKAAEWTGVGRQTVWGKGEIRAE